MKDVKWQNFLDKGGGEFAEMKLISWMAFPHLWQKIHTTHCACLSFWHSLSFFLSFCGMQQTGEVGILILFDLILDVRLRLLFNKTRFPNRNTQKQSQMFTHLPVFINSRVISCLDRKRTSPSAKDEHSAGVKDHLLAHSSDPVEMRRLNYQTQGISPNTLFTVVSLNHLFTCTTRSRNRRCV